MRPLAVLLGIIMGSSVAMAVSLAMTAIVFVLLGDHAARFQNEGGPLLRGLLWSWSAVGSVGRRILRRAAAAALARLGEGLRYLRCC